MSISFEPEEGYTVILPETEALQVRADKAREAIERDPGVRLSHLFPLVDATARFACAYMIAPQGCKPFELPRDPWLLVIGDDMNFAWGPQAFPSGALDAAIHAADQAVLITSGPDPYPYRVAATVAVRDRKNALIIETLPHQKERWQRRIESIRGSALPIFYCLAAPEAA